MAAVQNSRASLLPLGDTRINLMEDLSRRQLLGYSFYGAALATTAAASVGEPPAVPANELPFRHIHLDFHTSPAITGVGERFNAGDFAKTLKDASINSITVFAKCHHGMSYYPTKVGVGHPNLKIDLLGEMIEACHQASIKVPVYISTMY